jgi:spermidine synthase
LARAAKKKKRPRNSAAWMFPLFLLLAATSGAAALIYEIVWLQMLELVIGSTALSVGILLAVFMGGLCAGSLALPHLAPRTLHPLRLYAAIELGIGTLGLAVLLVLPLVGRFYMSWAGHGFSGILMRGVAASVCLFPPTFLIGAALPALTRSLQRAPESTAGMGFLYATNIAGGFIGCLAAGFYLLRVYDITVATFVAGGLNAAIAMVAFVVSRRTGTAFDPAKEEVAAATDWSALRIYTGIALSGCCALGAETIWTRTLGLLFGASVYTFTLILAVFLAGLGLGSWVGSILSRSVVSAERALGWCQVLGAGAMAWAAYQVSVSLPHWPINPAISSSVVFTFELDFARACWTVFPSTVLWGASFSLALAAIPSNARHSAAAFARVYGANTIGAIVGALLTSLILIEWIGSQGAQQILIAVSAGAGLVLLLPTIRFRWVVAALVVVAAGYAVHAVPPLSKLLVAHGRYAATWLGKGDIVYAAEGLNSSVAVSKFADGNLTFHVAGKIQASTVPRDLRLQRMLGHLTTLTVAHPRSVLVIGCGAGITAGAVAIDPEVEHETIVEIEALVPKAASHYFSDANFEVLRNPKVQLLIDDGRHYLFTTREHFDGITVDPLDPWVKGAAGLYTQDVFESMKQHLNPGGSVTMYIQLFETTPAAVKSAIATFFEVFPNATLWMNPYEGGGHDLVLLGQVEPLRIDLDEWERRADYRNDSPVAQSLMEVGLTTPLELLATYGGAKRDLQEWLVGAAINRDSNLRMQYLAGVGLDLDESAAIHNAAVSRTRFPREMFRSVEGRVDSLERAWQRAR